ncbi:hypothetical protein G7076_02260 [Sphingomonas sp. HDW15A]|uniref:hypothetical protein n=1 Tax=Sphingomonas sp. HDW15A TaxID=2714942 RepID=UPI001409741F|nr:hypothetical protein [Sphingomonas sp. HDW15A]QIK95466.1 hypothetical protein G7076_02260 [Sphingomonas sp. HDW15A]
MTKMESVTTRRARSIALKLVGSSVESRRHAQVCRDLARGCLTEDGARTLSEIATKYELEADRLEALGL